MALQCDVVTCLCLRERVGIEDRVRAGFKAHKIAQLQLVQNDAHALLWDVRAGGNLASARWPTGFGVEVEDHPPHQILIRFERLRPLVQKSRPRRHAPAKRMPRGRRGNGRPVRAAYARPDLDTELFRCCRVDRHYYFLD